MGSIITVNRVSGDDKGKLELPGRAARRRRQGHHRPPKAGQGEGDCRGSGTHPRRPKIVIQRYKNKTGYKRRQGHRQDLTRIQVTGIK